MAAVTGRPDLRDFGREDARCALEHHPQAVWQRRQFGNGGVHIEFYCPTCDRAVTKERYGTRGQWVTAAWFAEHIGPQVDAPAEKLELARRSYRFHLCYLCGVTALCEFHHVAPQAIYGEDADKYPIVPLCKPCHGTATADFTARLEKYVQREVRKALTRYGISGEAAD